MSLSEFLQNTNVSFYMHVKSSSKFGDFPIQRILNGIRTCFYQEQVQNARERLWNDDIAGYNEIKSNLPAVTFCGKFSSAHKADECVQYNNLMVLDIDKLEHSEVKEVYDCLLHDPYITTFWLSPSGLGFKGLVRLEYASEFSDFDVKVKHKIAFQQLYIYLLSNYGIELDKSGKDISRLCYMSADSNLQVNEESSVFTVVYEPNGICDDLKSNSLKSEGVTISNVTNASWNIIYGKATNYKNTRHNRNLLLYILKKLQKRNISITETWENWVKVAFAIASSVHPEKGRELFLEFCRLDGKEHDENRSEQLIWNAYSKNLGKCNIGTIIYLARLKGILLDNLGCG